MYYINVQPPLLNSPFLTFAETNAEFTAIKLNPTGAALNQTQQAQFDVNYTELQATAGSQNDSIIWQVKTVDLNNPQGQLINNPDQNYATYLAPQNIVGSQNLGTWSMPSQQSDTVCATEAINDSNSLCAPIQLTQFPNSPVHKEPLYFQ
jgi:hypothetical protein